MIATSLSLNFEWVLYPYFSDAYLLLSLSGNRPSDSDSNVAFAIAQWKRTVSNVIVIPYQSVKLPPFNVFEDSALHLGGITSLSS